MGFPFCIEGAQAIDVDVTAMLFDAETFYDLLGFPSPSDNAGADALANPADPFAIDLWTLHAGATYALTCFVRGKEESIRQRYQRIATDVLFNWRRPGSRSSAAVALAITDWSPSMESSTAVSYDATSSETTESVNEWRRTERSGKRPRFG